MGGDYSMTTDSAGEHTTSISALHPDVIQTHILNRLDGPALTSAGCASTQIRALSAEEKLWRDICNQTWPSTTDPRIQHLISTFSAGHRSFYSDCFPTLHHRRQSQTTTRKRPPPPSKLISAVDIRYQSKPIFSKVEETDTVDGLTLPSSSFRVDLLDEKETVPLPVKLDFRDEKCPSTLGENLTVSWIVFDPARNRAGNISSLRPVSAVRNWLSGDIHIRYVTVVAGERRGDLVQCLVTVTCGEREGGELQAGEVSLQVEDMDGKKLSWRESLVILEESVRSGTRRKGKRGEERERFEEYLKLKKVRMERRRRIDASLDLVLCATGVAIFVTFGLFGSVKFLQLLQFCCS